MIRMPWGKYRGEFVSDLPSSYLCWLLDEAESAPAYLRVEAEQELCRRFGRGSGNPPPPPPTCDRCARVRAAFQGWYRRHALALHPDRGGSEQGMRLLNDLKDALQTLLES